MQHSIFFATTLSWSQYVEKKKNLPAFMASSATAAVKGTIIGLNVIGTQIFRNTDRKTSKEENKFSKTLQKSNQLLTTAFKECIFRKQE